MGSWGHDQVWERNVVERIRRGGPAPIAYALYDNISQEHWGVRTGLATGYVYYDQQEAEERVLKNKQFRESLRAAQEAAKIRNAKEAEERKARAEEWRAKRAEQEAERAKQHALLEREAQQRFEDYQRNRPIEIAERIEHSAQEHRIMSSKWLCTVCGGKSFIERKNPGYQITCMSCEKTAWGSHASLWKVLNK